MGLPTNIITLLSGDVDAISKQHDTIDGVDGAVSIANEVNQNGTHLTALQESCLHILACALDSPLREAPDNLSMRISTLYQEIEYFNEHSYLERAGDIKAGFWKGII